MTIYLARRSRLRRLARMVRRHPGWWLAIGVGATLMVGSASVYATIT